MSMKPFLVTEHPFTVTCCAIKMPDDKYKQAKQINKQKTTSDFFLFAF